VLGALLVLPLAAVALTRRPWPLELAVGWTVIAYLLFAPHVSSTEDLLLLVPFAMLVPSDRLGSGARVCVAVGCIAPQWLNGALLALDYRETAPAGATPDRFLVDGRPDPSLTVRGGLAVAVPGEVAGWVALHGRFGEDGRFLAGCCRVASGAAPEPAAAAPDTAPPPLQGPVWRLTNLRGVDPTALAASFSTPSQPWH
jgi:hypothetical protein